MNRIMLLCSSGMSSSLLVERMERAAKEIKKECTIWASSEVEAKNQLDKCDLILLGPQVRFLKGQFQKLIDGKNIKLDVIDITSYGKMDGMTVLKHALVLLEQL